MEVGVAGRGVGGRRACSAPRLGEESKSLTERARPSLCSGLSSVRPGQVQAVCVDDGADEGKVQTETGNFTDWFPNYKVSENP